MLVLDEGRFAEFAVEICLFLFCFVVLWTRGETVMEGGCCRQEVEDKGRFAWRSVNILFACSGRGALLWARCGTVLACVCVSTPYSCHSP